MKIAGLASFLNNCEEHMNMNLRGFGFKVKLGENYKIRQGQQTQQKNLFADSSLFVLHCFVHAAVNIF